MPSEEELPPSIADLLEFQDAEVTDRRWAYDVGLLVQAIDDLHASPPIPVSYLSRLMERSQAATLNLDEQLALVARLKVAFGRASERAAAEEVLRSLQNRDDLYQVSAREIETILAPLDRRPPVSAEAAKTSQRKSSTRKWEVDQLDAEEKKLVLELRRYDRHILEFRHGRWPYPTILDGKKVTRGVFEKETFEFEDGDEKVNAEVISQVLKKKILRFELTLDNELVYRLR